MITIFFWPSTWHCLPLGWLETLRLSGNFGHLLSVCLTARSLWFFVGLAAPKEVLQPASCTYRNPSQVEPPSWEATSNVVWPTMTGFHRKTSSIRLKGVLHKASDLTQSIAGAHTPTSISIVVFSSSLAIWMHASIFVNSIHLLSDLHTGFLWPLINHTTPTTPTTNEQSEAHSWPFRWTGRSPFFPGTRQTCEAKVGRYVPRKHSCHPQSLTAKVAEKLPRPQKKGQVTCLPTIIFLAVMLIFGRAGVSFSGDSFWNICASWIGNHFPNLWSKTSLNSLESPPPRYQLPPPYFWVGREVYSKSSWRVSSLINRQGYPNFLHGGFLLCFVKKKPLINHIQ